MCQYKKKKKTWKEKGFRGRFERPDGKTCKYTTSVDIQTETRYKKASHSCSERSEPAREWRIALYKSDQQQQQKQRAKTEDWFRTSKYKAEIIF